MARTPDYPGLIRYPFPLGDGDHAFLLLPRSLTRADAERIKHAIDALVVEPAVERDTETDR